MSISKSERDYWTSEVKKRLDRKILDIPGSARILTTAKSEADEITKKKLGIVDPLKLLEALSKEEDDLKEKYYAAKSKREECEEQIRVVIYGHIEDDNERTRWKSLEHLLGLVSEAEIVTALELMDNEDAKKIADILKSKKKVETSIMLATSQERLRTALQSICETLGISLEA